jgi:hypothetical protein
MRENVVATANAPQLEAQRLGETTEVAEANIGHIAAGEPLEELVLIHDEDRTHDLGWPTRPTRVAPALSCKTDHYLDGYSIELIETG